VASSHCASSAAAPLPTLGEQPSLAEPGRCSAGHAGTARAWTGPADVGCRLQRMPGEDEGLG